MKRLAAARAVRRAAGLAAAGLVLLLAACAPEPATGDGAVSWSPIADHEIEFIDDVDFGGPAGIRLDVCRPAQAAPGAPAILSVHGGGWRAGDKAQPQWREACAWLASEGFVVFQSNYRLAPDHPFPAGLDDLETALDWIRDDGQAATFGHDPSRVAAFGDSAGGNLVSLLGLRGATASGTLRGVVELSAPLDLTQDGAALGDLDDSFQRVQLDYLGCETYDDCPSARAASPMHAVEPGAPPFFIVHAEDDFIPVEQADAFVAALEEAAVDVVLERVEGDGHALDLLDGALRDRIVDWLRARLDA
ncbi:alpha/beta hydrolase [Labedella endophytica]|uniref:Alpha/beta hydrolase n=1 Tax=Labedella endophytica TaxID=1523160 RepID=A0A3S0WWG5_9MICO|nr:alpha/beta hydrolase [Labedella endophytica]RUQ99091.1 alpha/beta hydrolase [Labedella endophytica]